MPLRATLDLTPLRPDAPDPAKLGLLALVALYLAGSLLDPTRGNLVGGIVFYTHEAGHWIFGPFGTFMMIAGGTITQLALPIAFVGYFLRQGQPFSAAVTLFWLSMAFLGASVYAGDAIALEQPLSHTWMSGQEELEAFGDTRHDWHNMLGMLGVLRPPVVGLVSGLLRLAGTLSFALALYAGLVTAGAPVPARLSWPLRPPRRQPPAGPRRAPGRRRPGPRGPDADAG